MKRCKAGDGKCVVTQSGKSCIHCRYTKCINIGMRPELVRGKRKKKDEHRESERAHSESEDSDMEVASARSTSSGFSDSYQAEG